MRRAAVAAAVALGLAGCSLHFGSDPCADADDVGYDEAAGDDAAPPLIDPATLQCVPFDWPYCDPNCGPCPDPEPLPTWAYCQSPCTGLDELTCLDATACRAVYDYGCYTGQGGPCDAITPYIGCYGVDSTGPIQGSCAGLAAQECSRHDDCIALHMPLHCSADNTDCWGDFVECRDESTCWGPLGCALDPPVDPPECVPGSTPEIRNGCYTGNCIPLDECEPMPDQ